MKKTEKKGKAPTRLLRNAEKTDAETFLPAPHIPESDTLLRIVRPLALWYADNARPLPWREGRDAYRVWLSEIMLQQTRVEAVRPYYARFLEAAPTVSALAALSEDRLLKLWQGLGYYSRARNLHRAAREIMEKHGGELPADCASLRALPGIGDYTAGAIASIAFGLPIPAVDGNVLRVVARVLGDKANVLAPETKKRVTDMLAFVYERANGDEALREELASRDETLSVSAALTEGLMELGQTHCAPNRAPLCVGCPLADFCAVRKSGEWESIPCREKKKERRTEHRLVLILSDEEGKIALRRRPDRGLLASLWELPNLLLSDGELTDAELDALGRDFCKSLGLAPAESASAPNARHIFTHITWQMRGRFYNVLRTEASDPALVFVSPEQMRAEYALPSAFSSYLALFGGEE